MPSMLESISAKPVIREFAQGAAQQNVQPVADFLAPTVEVPTIVGRYKVYTEQDRFRIPDTRRALGGQAAQIGFSASDAFYNCQPNALDFPIDNLESAEEATLENLLQEGAQIVAEAAALQHETRVINKAIGAITNTVNKTWSGAGTTDPVDDVDAAILAVIKAAKYGSLMGVGVLFGASAWRGFKNNANVRSKFVVGTGGEGSVGLAVPSEGLASKLFVGTPDVRTSYMVFDSADQGAAANINFVLDTKVIVFARLATPTRRDPSFMKTFRLAGQWMKPGSYVTPDGRGEVAKFDWTEDVEVTNAPASQLLNIS